MLLYAYYFPTYWLTYLSCQQSSKTFYFVNTPLHLDCLLFEEIAKKMFFLPREDFLWPAFMLKCQTRTVYAEHYIFFLSIQLLSSVRKVSTYSFLLSFNSLILLIEPTCLRHPPCSLWPPSLLTPSLSFNLLTVSSFIHFKFTLLGPLLCLPISRRRPS